MFEHLRIKLIAPLFGVLFIAAMCVAGNAAGGNTNIRVYPSAAPSLYPLVTISTPPTAYPTGGAYLAAPQGVPTNLPTPGGTNLYIGTLEGTTCFARIAVPVAVATPVATTEPTSAATTMATTVPTSGPSAVPTTYATTFPTSVPTSYATMWPQASVTLTTPNGLSELCSYPAGLLLYFSWDAPNFFNIQQGTDQTAVSINGEVYPSPYTSYGSILTLRIPRNIGTTYTGSTYQIGGTSGEYTFAVGAPSVAAQATNPPQTYAPPKAFLGAFARVDGPPSFGVHAMGWPTYATPSPYPAPTTLLYGSTGYCDEQDGSGRSIVNTNPVDYYKMLDLVQTGVQFTRTPVSPFELDKTHASGGFAWTDMDSALCGIVRNGIEPIVEIDAGPVFYGSTENNLYKSPSDYGAEASAVATHVSQTFSSIYRFECGNNEPNDGGWDASLSNNPSLYAGISGVSLYTRACYTAIKAVIPNAVVYWGMLAMDSDDAPLTFIQGFYANGCRFGYCADGLDIHLSPKNDPLANYAAYPTDNGVEGDGNDIRIFDNLIKTMKDAGETRPIHFLLGESVLCPTTLFSTNQQCGNLGDQAYLWPRWLSALQQNTQYNVDGVVIANLDDDELYPNSVFENNGIYQTIFSPVSQTWTNTSVNPTPSPRPAAVAIQQYMGLNPASLPTVAPSTAPTSVSTPGQPTVVQESANTVTTGLIAGSSSATPTPTLPAAATSTSVVFAFVSINSAASPAIATPSGWTLAATQSYTQAGSGNAELTDVFERTGFTGTSQAFSASVGTIGSGWTVSAALIEVSGAKTSAPVDAGSCFGTVVTISADGSYNAADCTPSTSATLALTAFWLQDGSGGNNFSGAAPTGWTNIVDTMSPSNTGYESGAIQRYNSMPISGTALQTSVTAGVLAYTPQTLASYELFVAHP